MIVQIDYLILRDGINAVNDGWYFTELNGWDDLPDSKSDVEERPDSHGAFGQGEILRAAKVPEVRGFYVGSSSADVQAKRKMLKEIIAQDSFRVTVTDDLESAWATVSTGSADIDRGAHSVFEFAIDFVQVDPRTYTTQVDDSTGLPVAGGGLTWPVSWPVSWGVVGDLGRVEFVNVGTASSWPVFSVWGGLPEGFTLAEVGTGREIRFDGPIPEGHYLLVNPRTGLALLDGVEDRSGMLSRSDWWSVPAGGSSEVQFTSNGGTSGVPRVDTSFASANW